jgi:hypothetical protein
MNSSLIYLLEKSKKKVFQDKLYINIRKNLMLF